MDKVTSRGSVGPTVLPSTGPLEFQDEEVTAYHHEDHEPARTKMPSQDSPRTISLHENEDLNREEVS